MDKMIESISFKNYRGFKDEQVLELAGNNNITFLVGQNNAGKSLIARALTIINKVTGISQGFGNILTDYEFHSLNIDEPFTIDVTFSEEVSSSVYDRFGFEAYNVRKSLKKFKLRYLFYKSSDTNLNCNCVIQHDEFASYELDKSRATVQYSQQFEREVENHKGILSSLVEFFIDKLKSNFLIFAPIRSLNITHNDAMTGRCVLEWQNDTSKAAAVRKAKETIGRYLRRLNLEEPSSVSAEKDVFRFTFKKHLDLTSEDIGTGYTMIYILLMEIMKNTTKIVIIDEIESHLQPGLIRELIRIIREVGKGQQFIISTHSPTVMESANENDYLYHFKKVDNSCSFTKFYTRNDDARIRTVTNDLGIIPGDALLSNCVIWVEGPSEILWLRAWMKAYLPSYLNGKEFNLLEGLHYSILMTGGSSIANISFKEHTKDIVDIEEDYMLKVLRVNPNPFVIIDSDGSKHDSGKFQRNVRIAKELNEQNKTAPWCNYVAEEITYVNISSIQNLWLLKGRELENYCHPELLKQFYTNRSAHNKSKIKGTEQVPDWDVYSTSDGIGKVLSDRGMSGVSESSGTTIHKGVLASFVFQNLTDIHFEESPMNIEQPNGEMLTDLKTNLKKLFSYIQKANGLS